MVTTATQRPALRLIPFVASVLMAMVAIRLCYFGLPAGRDEAGFLIVGSSWDHGPWLYGQYWVDRPPLLIWIMELAGNLTVLRCFGLIASVVMVLGVCRATFVMAGSRAALWAAGAAALFSTAHWFGVARTNGEMLASPFVAWSIALAAQALLRPTRRSWMVGVAAGAVAAGAVLIKQTIADGLVFALVLAAVLSWQHRDRKWHVAGVIAGGLLGFFTAIAIALGGAAARGTSPTELFDALVTFRADAGEVIRLSSSSATNERFWILIATWAVSGLAFITAMAVWRSLRQRDPALLAITAVLAVVSATSVLGGSYWAHYLLQLVPAAAIAAGLMVDAINSRTRLILTGFVVAATASNLILLVVIPPKDGLTAKAVGTWIKESSEPSDTAVVAYGQPNVLSNAAMSSPYPYLWSLPVRTLDADLSTLSSTLTSADRPTWFVDWSGIDSWGISDPAKLTSALHEHYREVATVCGRTLWLDRDEDRAVAPTKECR